MKYCKKCNKSLQNQRDTYRDLCTQCYYEFLLECIDNAQEGKPVFEPYKEENAFLKFIKNLFKKG